MISIVKHQTSKVKKKSKEFLKRDAERKRRKYVPIALRSEKEQRVVREKNREKKRAERAKKNKSKPKKTKFKDFTSEERKKYVRDRVRAHRQKQKCLKEQLTTRPKIRCMTPAQKREYERERKFTQRSKVSTDSSLSRATLYRKVKQVKSVLPRTPEKYATCISQIVKDATTHKIKRLKTKGIAIGADAENSVIADNIKEAVNQIRRGSLTNKKREKLYWLVKYRSGGKYKIGRKLGSSDKVWKKAKLNVSVKKNRKSDCISKKVTDQVKEFWLFEVSRELPLKKRVKKNLPTHLLEFSYIKAYKKFKQKFPEVSIGYTKFIQLKPGNVRHMKTLERIVCCCIRCENIKKIIQVMNRCALKNQL